MARKMYPSKTKDKIRRDKARGRRFLSLGDLAIIKHDIAVKNSQIKRGEREKHAVSGISMCGCGGLGCAIHYDIPPPEDMKKRILKSFSLSL
jgi:hypothetical protein